MYRISELAESLGRPPEAPLSYGKLGLLKGKRQANGVRVYSDADHQRLRLMQQLQLDGVRCQVPGMGPLARAGGLTRSMVDN